MAATPGMGAKGGTSGVPHLRSKMWVWGSSRNFPFPFLNRKGLSRSSIAAAWHLSWLAPPLAHVLRQDFRSQKIESNGTNCRRRRSWHNIPNYLTTELHLHGKKTLWQVGQIYGRYQRQGLAFGLLRLCTRRYWVSRTWEIL